MEQSGESFLPLPLTCYQNNSERLELFSEIGWEEVPKSDETKYYVVPGTINLWEFLSLDQGTAPPQP